MCNKHEANAFLHVNWSMFDNKLLEMLALTHRRTAFPVCPAGYQTVEPWQIRRFI